MELTHYLNGALIDEPIGFDDLKMSLKRGDYYGMSIEVSETSLEFYGAAATIVKAAYDADIDTEVEYKVLDETGAEYFKAYLDLTTITEKDADYYSVACKVGEIGAKTTFNNRTETDVDLNTDKTIDGDALGISPVWHNIAIPMKHLPYTNLWQFKEDKTYTKTSVDTTLAFIAKGHGYGNDLYLTFKNKADEFGQTDEESLNIYCPSLGVSGYRQITPLYEMGDKDDFEEEFGKDTTCKITGTIKMKFRWLTCPVTGGANTINATLTIWGYNADGSAVPVFSTTHSFQTPENGSYPMDSDEIEVNLDSETEYTTDMELRAHIVFNTPFIVVKSAFNAAEFELTMLEGTYIKMVMMDNLEDTGVSAKMIMVHDALNIVSAAISENALSVKSEYYRRTDSAVNAGSNGNGSLKALTNGYKIRDLFTTADTERSMPLSFKDAIKALNVLDCVGWGFSNEDGADYIRVEPWDWFYKNDIVAEITGISELTRTMATDSVTTELVIGFKKYEDADSYNSIDSVHGERTMNNKIKALTSKKSQQCDFIADNYCIEETRRARTDTDSTEEFKYDENIFVFELAKSAVIKEGVEPLFVPNNVKSATGVNRTTEQINVQLTPRRCAERWRSRLFATNSQSAFRLTSGKINYKAAFACLTGESAYSPEYLYDIMQGESLAEDADIEYQKAIFKAELVTFTCPITMAQYKAIKANPYGLICYNGEYGWIKELSYTFDTGEATFKITPKA